MLKERCIVNNNMDVIGQINSYIPEPDFAVTVEERVVVTHNKTWLPHNSRDVIPTHASRNVSSSLKVSCCLMRDGNTVILMNL